MASVSANTYFPVQDPTYTGMQTAAAGTYYQGQLVFLISSGITLTATAAKQVAGICAEYKVVAAAGELVNVMTDGLVGLPNTNFDGSHVGTLCNAYLSGTPSNNLADALPTATARTGDMPFGLIVDYNNNGYTWVDLGQKVLAVAK